MTENGAEIGRDPCRPGHPQERSPGLGGPRAAGCKPRGLLRLLQLISAAATAFFSVAVKERLSTVATLAYLTRLAVRRAYRRTFGSVRLTQPADGVVRRHPGVFCPRLGRCFATAVMVSSGRDNDAGVAASLLGNLPLPPDLTRQRTFRAIAENLLA